MSSVKKTQYFDYARAGLEAFATEPINGTKNPTLSEMRVRGVVNSAKSSKKPLTIQMKSVLEEALSYKLVSSGNPKIIEDAIMDTRKAAKNLKGFLKKGSGVVAIGNSPEKVGFVLESTGHIVTYPLMSRPWLESSALEAVKKKRFSELFADTISLIDPETGPCTELVFVDYARTFSTFFAVDAMLRKWYPEVRKKSRFVVMYDDETNEANLRTVELMPGWDAFEVSMGVYMLAKNFRCNSKLDNKGGVTKLHQQDIDFCDAIRLLISPDYFSKAA
jgi:hypothetical protein